MSLLPNDVEFRNNRIVYLKLQNSDVYGQSLFLIYISTQEEGILFLFQIKKRQDSLEFGCEDDQSVKGMEEIHSGGRMVWEAGSVGGKMLRSFHVDTDFVERRNGV